MKLIDVNKSEKLKLQIDVHKHLVTEKCSVFGRMKFCKKISSNARFVDHFPKDIYLFTHSTDLNVLGIVGKPLKST